MLKLQLRDQPQVFVKLSFATVTLGRDESNDLVLNAPTVSDFHAEVTCESHRYYITDLLSASGTFVNNERISGRHEVQSWDVIRLGGVELEVNDPGKCRPGDWALQAASNQLASQVYRLQDKTLVGRDPECDISIDDSLLSRKHAKLYIEGDHLRVVDLGSANGTFLNGKPIDEAKALPGDELRFDQQVFHILGPSHTQLRQEAADDGRTQLRSVESAPVHEPVPLVPKTKATEGKVNSLPDETKAPLPKAPVVPLNAAIEETVLMPAADETQFLGGAVEAVASERPAAHLVEHSQLLSQSEWTLQDELYLLGRSENNNLVLSDPSVSKNHAQLSYVQGHWQIEDLGARNGVKLNGAAIDKARLQNGDQITLGRVVLEFRIENGALDDPLVTAFAQAQDTDPDATRPVPEDRRPRKTNPPSWLYGGLLLAAGLLGAGAIYLWRAGLLTG